MSGQSRILVIGLDAFESTVAGSLIAEGRLPNLARLASVSARFFLDHGPERFTGQAWHQFTTGLHPSQSGRWSALRFDPRTYDVEQPETTELSFTRNLGRRTVVFDVPHFNLETETTARGIANWGSHDAGVPRTTTPAGLWDEIESRFGAYPAEDHIYGIVWESEKETERMAGMLADAVDLRRRIARWLLEQRLPDWNLAFLAISEFHSAVETMWHGWDVTHPLHGAPSGRMAREALVAVYEGADRLVGEMMDAFPDASIVAFSPHGMGANYSDTSGMILMAELMYRHSLGRVGFPPTRPSAGHIGPWSKWVNERLTLPSEESGAARLLSRLSGRRAAEHPLDWMPTARYRHAWPQMKAFAIPAYHDARIRLNVEGREASGIVPQAEYRATLEETAAVVSACVDAMDGRPLDIEIEFPHPDDPLAVTEWEADIVVRFRRNALGYDHPTLGRIGLVPHRRTGGHTGGYGVAYLMGEGIAAGDRGVVSTFDVVPMISDLVLGRPPASALGRALRRGPKRARRAAVAGTVPERV